MIRAVDLYELNVKSRRSKFYNITLKPKTEDDYDFDLQPN